MAKRCRQSRRSHQPSLRLTAAGASRRSPWRSPSWEWSDRTLDYLLEAGITISANYFDRVRPYRHVRDGKPLPLVELPVQWHLADAPYFMTAELFAMLTGVKIEHIPYKGGTPAMTDLISGQIDFMFTPAPNAIAFVKSGKIRGIAVTSLKRSSALPELPTMDESGLKGFELLGWIGLLGPAGTPREIVDRLNSEINKMLAGDIRGRLTELGLDAVGGTPEQFAAFIRQDIAKYAKIVKAARIPPQ